MSSIEKAIERLSKSDNQRQNVPHTDAHATLGDNTQNRATSRSDGRSCILNFTKLNQQGFLTPETTNKKLADEYRTLKRHVLNNAKGKGATIVESGNIILVASALPAEGKTFTSFNLAMSIAMEKDTTVLLVDSDIIKSSLTKMLGLKNAPGLTDVILDQSISLADVIVKTNVQKLNVIPSGRGHTHSTELLASANMERIAHELSQRYSDRVVVFDAPPILVTTEAPVLARLAGQILVVVEAGRTQQNHVKDAVGLLDGTKAIGMVLNKSSGSAGGGYYGYGYYGA